MADQTLTVAKAMRSARTLAYAFGESKLGIRASMEKGRSLKLGKKERSQLKKDAKSLDKAAKSLRTRRMLRG